MIWWGKLSDRQKCRRLAAALWSTPLIMFFPLWLGVFVEPSALIEYWELFLLFFGLPFAAAGLLYFYAGKLDPTPPAPRAGSSS